jgi:hypothetical protein
MHTSHQPFPSGINPFSYSMQRNGLVTISRCSTLLANLCDQLISSVRANLETRDLSDEESVQVEQFRPTSLVMGPSEQMLGSVARPFILFHAPMTNLCSIDHRVPSLRISLSSMSPSRPVSTLTHESKRRRVLSLRHHWRRLVSQMGKFKSYPWPSHNTRDLTVTHNYRCLALIYAL